MCLQFWKPYKVTYIPNANFKWLYIRVVTSNFVRDESLIPFVAIFWVLMMSGYYYSNIGSETWVCIHIEIDGTQFELLILYSTDRGWFVRAIDILELGYILILWVLKIALYFVWIWPHKIYYFIHSKNPSCRCDDNFESSIKLELGILPRRDWWIALWFFWYTVQVLKGYILGCPMWNSWIALWFSRCKFRMGIFLVVPP